MTGSELFQQEFAYHFVASANKDGHGPGVGTLLDDHHLIPRGSKSDFADDSRLP
jgi:hypothetical protein